MAPSRTKPASGLFSRGTVPTSLLDSVVASLPSPHTRSAYTKGITDLVAFAAGRPFTLPLLYDWRLAMSATLSAATVNLRLSAVRKLFHEAHRAGKLDAHQAFDLLQVQGLPFRGERVGNWLTVAQLRRLLAVPHRSGLRGHRNYCIVAILAGCALRLDELARLDVATLQQRDGRWVFADLLGKGGRVRTVAVPAFVKTAIDAWLRESGIKEGRLIRQLTLKPEGLSTEGIRDIVQKAAAKINLPSFSPHDARRTCARLCRDNGAGVEQIQVMLGHASLVTTQRYLGTVQNLRDAPNDHLGL